MTRSVSFLTIICMVIDGFIQTRNKTYYTRVFRHRDCIPMTGFCWVLGFMVAISPFSNARWQCHVYHALTSPVVFNLDSNLWNHIEFNNVMFLIIILPMVIMPIFGTIQLTSAIKFETDEALKRKQKVTNSGKLYEIKSFKCSIILHYLSILSLLPACLTISAKVQQGSTVSDQSDILGKHGTPKNDLQLEFISVHIWRTYSHWLTHKHSGLHDHWRWNDTCYYAATWQQKLESTWRKYDC